MMQRSERSTNPEREPRRGRPGCHLARLIILTEAIWLSVNACSSLAADVTASIATPLSHGTGGAYVSNELCLECHKPEAKQWAMSHHFQAMARATKDTVLGNFADAKFERDGVTSRFFRRGDAFLVHTDGPNGTLADFPIAFTFGVDPLQQYLIELPGGRLQGLTIACDTARKRWFDLYPGEKTPPGDALHWTGRYQNWNMMCAACHSTNVRKNYDAATDRYDTTYSDINVSCQACHGPGEMHVVWARAREKQQPPPPGIEGDGLAVNFRSAGAAGEVDLCAPCHSRRSELTTAPLPGTPLYDNFLPSLLTEDLYYADGQQLDEVYEYGSFRQAKMYRKGVRCTDCHDPHTMKPKAQGNALCVRCHHIGFGSAAARDYDSPGHHFHKSGSPGSLCVNCHMPARNYMIVHARRDHAIRIPRPDLTVKIGTPNACTECHANHPAKWAADAVARWYASNRQQERHYGQILAAGRAGRPDAEEALVKLVEDSDQPAIVRATALNLLRRYGPASVPASSAATHDTDPAVRAAAVASLERVPPEQRVPAVGPLLTDPTRAVRIEAARVLSSAPPTLLDAAQRHAFDAALAEFVAAQNISLDMPGAHLNLAVVDENQGQTTRAEEEYRHALRLDPDFTPARLNLAQLLNRLSRNADAEKVLSDGIARTPDQGELQYSLGLLLAEEQRLPDAAAALGRAAQLMPARGRVRYNYGLALQRLGRRTEAEAAFTRAHELDPGDPEPVYALVVMYLQSRQWTRARSWAEDLATLAPNDPDVQALLERLRKASVSNRPAPRVTR